MARRREASLVARPRTPAYLRRVEPGPEPDLLLDLPGLRVPRSEVRFRATRAGGPGGQHVNTSSTRVELLWDFGSSPAVDEATATQLRARLARRLDAQGRLRIVAQANRSQLQNREAAERRLVEVVGAALTRPKRRRATRPTAASRRKRLEEKKRKSRKKQERRRPPEDA